MTEPGVQVLGRFQPRGSIGEALAFLNRSGISPYNRREAGRAIANGYSYRVWVPEGAATALAKEARQLGVGDLKLSGENWTT